ncbi:ABC transporter permease [Variovorax sp. PCZ-1]|uniref:ABC transporter permease n=1 Tax=Variovorax sp. PCZ-1 TaxID=2835533 RepID=UPI001BCF017F|nr:ABC transporter permease [Variovorax sp. PCZ-1]MBS7806720.1 ABC transporter permease [Variovorax sp. PCZ-1]
MKTSPWLQSKPVLSLIGLLTFFGIWYFAAIARLIPQQFLPMPHEVVIKLIDLTQTPFAGHVLHEHMLSSLSRFGMGFLLASLIGVPLGLLMGWFGWLDDIVSPLFDALRFIAPVAWVPFAALWFGTGIGGPTLIIFAGAFPPCLINAYRGAKGVEIRYVEAASMLGVGSFKTITEVLFPAAVPSIIAGLRIGAGLGWMSLVGAELIASSSGMGYLIVKGQSSIATDIVMAGMLAIGFVGVLIDVALRKIEARLLAHRR